MNATLPIGHRDPRTEMVPVTYLRLAVDLLVTAHHNLEYWNTVPIPSRPTNRVAFEELRQLTVFLPLFLVTLAFVKFGFTGALLAFIVALPLMIYLHKSLARAIVRKGIESRERDSGRYAFTEFMCQEFDLPPEDVTMGLVLKMSADFSTWLETATRLRLRDEAAAYKGPTTQSKKKAVADMALTEHEFNLHRAAGIGAMAAGALTATDEVDAMPLLLNPATGLPMLNDVIDLHGNTFGLTNVDDMLNDMSNINSVDVNFYGGFESHLTGFEPGIGGFENE